MGFISFVLVVVVKVVGELLGSVGMIFVSDFFFFFFLPYSLVFSCLCKTDWIEDGKKRQWYF